VEIKAQLDATDWFLSQNLLFAQHVSGTIMPIIRSSRFIQMVTAYGTWRFSLQVVGLVWSCGLCVQFAGCFSTSRAPLCPSSGAQDLYRWLLPMVPGALVYRSLVWCGTVGYVSGLRVVSRLVGHHYAHHEELD